MIALLRNRIVILAAVMIVAAGFLLSEYVTGSFAAQSQGIDIIYNADAGPLCEGDFEPDGDVDGSDLAVFAADFGRIDCGTGEPCEGDFDDDNDVDGSDLAVFTADFGRTDCPTSEPQFHVAPVDDWVASPGPWTPGATISLTIEDGSGVVYGDSQTADAAGNFNFDFRGVFDLQRGHVVTVSDGTYTKTHTVTNLYLDSVDVAADTVSGRADAGTSVGVWADENSHLTVTADDSGNWIADFSGMTDLTYLSSIGSQQTDSEGDTTIVLWTPPQFHVAPVDDWVASPGPWTPGATISLTIEDGSGVVYGDSQTADAAGNFNFDFRGVFDLQRGHVVTVSDGTYTKTHTVTNLYLDSVDVAADTVSGRADAGTSVGVWADENGHLTVTADGSGNWIADFSGMTDLTYLSSIGSQQTDSEGDTTIVLWTPPQFHVAPVDDWVASPGPWTPGATISLTIEDGSGVVYGDSQTADAAGNFNFDFRGVFDLQRGHVVTVSDGTYTKTHTVTNLYLDSVDVAADTVSGRADAGTSVGVWADENGHLTVTADDSGNWIADFSGMTDLTYLSSIGSQQTDSEGDTTIVLWTPPQFHVAPVDDWVASPGPWTPGATISLTIEDGSGVVYGDSQTADAAGNFNFDFRGVFDLQRGHVVTVSDGTYTKTHTVTNLYLDSVDVAADTVSGRADAGTSVGVWADENSHLTVTADGSGNWIADFSGMTDLTYLSSIGSQQTDSEGDTTIVLWTPPQFHVAPVDDWVASPGPWTPGATISLTIEDGSGVVYGDSQTADAAGNFNFDFRGVFDLQRGHVVTVSDGTYTKTHTVTNLYLDSVDVAADTVSGRADAGTSVGVWADENSHLTVTADGSGNWIADFSGMTDLTYLSSIGSQQTDSEGDTTIVFWTP